MDSERIQRARLALTALGYAEGIEETLVFVKPDGVQMLIHGAVAALYETHGLSVLHEKRIRFDASLAFAVYRKHEGMPYFQELIQHITSGDCKAYVLVGLNAAKRAHDLLGNTDPLKAAPTSVRGLFRANFNPDKAAANFVHAADNLAEAIHEIEMLYGRYPIGDIKE